MRDRVNALSDWSDDQRWASLCPEQRQALEWHAEARRQLDAATRELRRAERKGEPARVLAAACHQMRVADAVERLAYRRAAALLGSAAVTGPGDPGTGTSPAR